ncbi:MAG: anthranilate synthase component I family protein [Eggerthellaceae bacterium]|nr:anthranilate synthase component I family protein [Eggerthellaceae bacterium]
MYPSLEEAKRIAAETGCRRIPVAKDIMADLYTPIEVLAILREVSNHCFLLESAEQDERWGRYSFLGFDPSMEITCRDGLLRVRSVDERGEEDIYEAQVEHPAEYIRSVLEDHRSPELESMPPFSGGLEGYFSYNYLKYAEPTLRYPPMGNEEFLDVDLMLFNKVIVFDSYKQRIILISGVYADDIEASYDRAASDIDYMEEILRAGKRHEFEDLALEGELTLSLSRDEYCDMVRTAKNYIHEGDIFQVVLSNPLRARASGSLFDTYRLLRMQNPSPYMFYFTSDNIEIAGASPETLVRLQNGELTTYPLAGTRPRGATPEEDARLEAELLCDEKELAEHNMLVDLGRNDLGRISEIGSVKVEGYENILRFSKVMHIGSTVTGRIREGMDALDAVDSVLPAGTLSGAPKIRACEIIHELESADRGIYGGAIGYLDFAGNMDLCISIRLAYKKNGVVCVQSGAGIVADSVPETEFLECRNKAGAVVEALNRANGGLS